MTDIRLIDTRGIREHYSYWEMLAFEAHMESGAYTQRLTSVAQKIGELQKRRQALQDMADDLPSFWADAHVGQMQAALGQTCAMLDEAIKAYQEFVANYRLLAMAAEQALSIARQHPDYCFKADAWYVNDPRGLVSGFKTGITAEELRVRSTTNPYLTCPNCNHYHSHKHKGWHIDLSAEDVKT